MSSISQSAYFIIDSLKLAITCPANGERLNDPVSLAPCMHKVNAAAAITLTICPVCNREITACYPDDFTKKLVDLTEKILTFVDTLFPPRAPQAKNSKDEIKENKTKTIRDTFVVSSSKNPTKKAKGAKSEEIPIPGVAAKFELKSTKNNILRFECTPTVSRPLFHEFSIYCPKDQTASIWLSVSFTKNSKLVASYFSALGLEVELTQRDIEMGCLVSFFKDARILFKALIKHNEFPEGQVEYIQGLLDDEDQRRGF